MKRMNQLTDLATEQYKDKYTSYYLEAFYCDCDAYEILDPSMVIAGFDVLEQDEDSFQATSIVIGNHLYPGPGSTYYWTYKKENEKWKIDEVTAESADKQPLNLTTEDLKNYMVIQSKSWMRLNWMVRNSSSQKNTTWTLIMRTV